MHNLFFAKDDTFLDQFSKFLQVREQSKSDLTESVRKIIAQVKIRGDQALIDYTKKFDNVDLTNEGFFFTSNDIEKSLSRTKEIDREAIDLSINRILEFHHKQMPSNVNWKDQLGVELGWIWRPIDRVGVYVPGGKASYPSSAIMNIAPAKVAGVEDIVLVSPSPSSVHNPLVIYTAFSLNVSQILRLGGAQAIAALAYGTETLKKVDKITGPGNEYVAEAKRQVFGKVGIDSVAGPSEVLLICDKSMPSKIAAIDLLSQAEHDEKAQAILITNDREYALEVEKEITNYLEKLKRKEIAKASWENYGAIVIVPDFREAIEISNMIAPEHLQLCFSGVEKHLDFLESAGSVFIGYWSPEAMGDYITGSNHILPTGGTAKFSSALSVFDFMKRISITKVNKPGFKKLGPSVVRLAESEGLEAHSLSVLERLKNL